MRLTDADVEEIVRLLDDTPYRELDLETDSFRLVLRREAGEGWTQQRETLTEPHVVRAESEDARASDEAASTSKADPPSTNEKGLLEICAPIVGTFYRAPAPGAPPFVELGSQVHENTVVAIIEVMKLMNSVPSGVAGEVAEICVENAALVEQGQCLIRVRPVAP
jgi:acetyl-CoA carboxylase biotin carboxyl carrier protein